MSKDRLEDINAEFVIGDTTMNISFSKSQPEFDEHFHAIKDGVNPKDDEFKRTTVRPPEFVESAVGNIASEFNAGVYKTRSVMVLYGFRKLNKILEPQIKDLEEMFSTATNSSRFQAQLLNNRDESTYYSRSKTKPVGYYIDYNTAGIIDKYSRYFGMSSGLFIRHCMAVSVNHTEKVQVWDREAQNYERGIIDTVKDYRLPMVQDAFERQNGQGEKQ